MNWARAVMMLREGSKGGLRTACAPHPRPQPTPRQWWIGGGRAAAARGEVADRLARATGARQYWAARVLVLWVLWLGLAPLVAAVPTRLPRVVAYGREYVSLSLWAKAQKLNLAWDKPSGALELTNRSTRLAFTVDSRRAELNGVRVWLSVPITPLGREVLVAAIDLRTLLDPILWQLARNRPGQKVRTVALDPGHGGKDPGNEVAGEVEKKHTLLLARKVKSLLQEAGLRGVLTRATDQFVELDDRPAKAKGQRADLFVSLHYNAANQGKNEARGLEVYCVTPAGAYSTNARGDAGSTRAVPGNGNDTKNIVLAYQIQKAVVSSLKLEDRGVRRARFAVLRNAPMPAVLIEGGFMSDPREAKEIYDEGHREELARAIVDGILAYKRLVER